LVRQYFGKVSGLMKNKIRRVKIGSLAIGAQEPVLIQSMTNTKTKDVSATLEQINSLYKAGCEIIRVAVASDDDIDSFRTITKNSPMPVVADIHFNYKLAIKAIEAGAAKVRVNPGNLGGLDKLFEVSKAAKGRAAIRVGVNSGSLPQKYVKLIKSEEISRAKAMALAAKEYVDFLDEKGFNDIVVSLKASDVPSTIAANRQFRLSSDIPLHLGVTEAGTFFSGSIKSAVGLGTLLMEGIGETIRVSLTADPVEEIKVAREILKACGIRTLGPTVISCPTCARTNIDIYALAKDVEKLLTDIKEDITVAVMGCAVNGPGEAKEADLGIAGGKGEGLIFVRGEVVEKVQESDLLSRFQFHLDRIVEAKKTG